MKKLVLLLAVAFSVSLFSCGGAKTEAGAADTTDTTVADTTVADTTVADTVAAPAAAPAAADTAAADTAK